jgi:hypothetical protein
MSANEYSLIENFITLIDRYLEVSNLYNHRMTLDTESFLKTKQDSRLKKLVSVIQGAELDSSRIPLKELQDGKEESQSVVPTQEVINETGLYQKIVLGRLDRMNESPPNVMKLKARLQLDPIRFLGSFKSVSYAWDILTELASLSVLPEPEELAARDFIHMHCVELRLHLHNLITFYNSQTTILYPRNELPLHEQNNQRHLEQTKLLASKEPSELLEIIDHLIREAPTEIRDAISSRRTIVFQRLQQEHQCIPDSLGILLDQAVDICNDLVVFGLAAGYGIWYCIAINSQPARGLLRKNSLFATRILLDENRWNVCRAISQMSLGMTKGINALNQREESEGTHMLRANWYFSRKKCQEDIECEVREWDTTKIHKRYKFLQSILLDEFEKAAEFAESLLKVEPDTGRANLTLEEIREWPILEEFRKTSYGEQILK